MTPADEWADLEAKARAVPLAQAAYDASPTGEPALFRAANDAYLAFRRTANPATILKLIEAARRSPEGEAPVAWDGSDPWWQTVIGGEHKPSGEVASIKHLHPLMVKPIYEAHKGTAVADVIAGLLFNLSITQERERFLVEDANERRRAAEAALEEHLSRPTPATPEGLREKVMQAVLLGGDAWAITDAILAALQPQAEGE